MHELTTEQQQELQHYIDTDDLSVAGQECVVLSMLKQNGYSGGVDETWAMVDAIVSEVNDGN